MLRKKKTMIYLVIALIVLAPVIFFAILSMLGKKPANLGVENGRLASCPSSPNCVSTQATDEVHRIKAILFDERRTRRPSDLKK
jgi:uncharacterized protein (DUF1499 family)